MEGALIYLDNSYRGVRCIWGVPFVTPALIGQIVPSQRSSLKFHVKIAAPSRIGGLAGYRSSQYCLQGIVSPSSISEPVLDRIDEPQHETSLPPKHKMS